MSDSEKKEEIGFSAALGELEEILRRIEEEETDVDRLAGELGRAARLLEICRAKVRRAEVEVRQIVQTLETAVEPEQPAEAAPAGEAEDDDQDEIPF